jgi:hypothetical protein
MPSKKTYSSIPFVDLEDEIGHIENEDGYASISVLYPTIYLEVLEKKKMGPTPQSSQIDDFKVVDDTKPAPGDRTATKYLRDYDVRITTSFTLEAEILKFDDRYVMHIRIGEQLK